MSAEERVAEFIASIDDETLDYFITQTLIAMKVGVDSQQFFLHHPRRRSLQKLTAEVYRKFGPKPESVIRPAVMVMPDFAEDEL